MCWKNKNKPVKHIADKDIPVFKIGMLDGKEIVLPYFFQCGVEYQENTAYSENNISPFYSTKKEEHVIHKGLHSYALSNIRLKASHYMISGNIMPTVEIMTYRVTPMSQDVIVNAQQYDAQGLAIMLCIIPKGAIYYINEIGEMVSNEIEVKRIIKNPFTLNKDNTTSVRSVDKVNKSLNNWEKGKL